MKPALITLRDQTTSLVNPVGAVREKVKNFLPWLIMVCTICIRSKGSLAQLVEQLTFNQLVVGSNPTRPTIEQRVIRHIAMLAQ